MDNTDGQALSNKLKIYLNKKLEESEYIITKCKRKQTIIKTFYYLNTILSIIISTVIASISQIAIPPIVYTILSIVNGIIVAINMKFNLERKSIKIGQMIENKNKLRLKLDYIVSCNGDLDENIYKQILTEFTN